MPVSGQESRVATAEIQQGVAVSYLGRENFSDDDQVVASRMPFGDAALEPGEHARNQRNLPAPP